MKIKRKWGRGAGGLFLLSALLLSLSQGASAQSLRVIQAKSCMTQQESGEIFAEDRVNILLIGQDQRPGEPGKRSDSMILCSFFPQEKKLVLTSVLRDLYVKIPDYGYERINAAYAMGGAKLLERTLYENFGIPVDGYVEADFRQFSGIIDTMGGVKLTLREDEAREINKAVPWKQTEPGPQILDGDQTLAFARIRKLDRDSDFSRTERQRRILKSLTEAYRDMTFGEMVKLVKALLPAVSTDLNGFQILTYGKLFLPMLQKLQVESRRIPGEGAAADRKIRGMSVLVPDLDRIRQQVQDIRE